MQESVTPTGVMRLLVHIVLVAVACAAASGADPRPNPSAVVLADGGRARFTVLTDALVRMEWVARARLCGPWMLLVFAAASALWLRLAWVGFTCWLWLVIACWLAATAAAMAAFLPRTRCFVLPTFRFRLPNRPIAHTDILLLWSLRISRH